MTTSTSTDTRSLRLWPGVVLAALQAFAWFVLPVLSTGVGIISVIGTLMGGVGIVVWWVFFSRALWSDRLGALLLIIVSLAVTSRLLHVSVSNAGMGMLFYILAVPLTSFALVVGLVLSHRLADRPRRAIVTAVILLASAGWALVRTSGVTGGGGAEWAWRWSLSAEERLLAQGNDDPAPLPASPAPAAAPELPVVSSSEKPPETNTEKTATDKSADVASTVPATIKSADWPGFRGPDRDGIIPGVRIATDWSQSPPVQLWRRPIGPGWSSFAVDGDLLFTQEQRGDDEIVACYNAKTGEPVWRHRDPVRFWESNGGAGPRATPTLNNGRVYTLGATGVVNALDAATGAVFWSRNATADTGAKVQYWGFASSPLVVDDVVIVYAGALAAYELGTGKPRWVSPVRSVSYSSPHLLTIDGVTQIVLLSSKGATSFAPADGTVLWEHAWPGGTIVQPAITPDGDVLISINESTGGVGTRRLSVAREAGGWIVEERWTSNGLKPYFNDYVIHEGHAFGFDGSILACIDLNDGKRKWKGGRYGNGQLVLFPDQDLLLVLSEEGELAMVQATPDQFTEVARFRAIEGKTWNHPVLVGDVLLVRNGEEMAAFRLSLAGPKSD